MNTILILLIVAFLFGLWLTRPARALSVSTGNKDLNAALYNQLEIMERSLDATDRQFRNEQRQFRRELRQAQNPEPPPIARKPRASRQKLPSLITTSPRESEPEQFPESITIITPNPRLTLFTACTQILRTTASYAISLLRPLFQLPRTFTSFFTRPPTPRPTPTIAPSPQNHIA
jgi:hypothetical protein